MAKSRWRFSNKNIEAIKEKAKPELYQRCINIVADMEEKFKSVIIDFYRDYTPEVYKRKYAMPFIMHDPEIKETEYGYLITLRFSGDDMTQSHPKDSTDVFRNAFVYGFHGYPAAKVYLPPRPEEDIGYIPQFLPSPWDRIREYAQIMYNAKEIK